MPKRVQVVLNEDVLSLGKDGDLVEVAPVTPVTSCCPSAKLCPSPLR
jgi:large subunit ribosomal protein L9